MFVMKVNLSSTEREIVNKILDMYFPNTSVWVFGSRASGLSKPFSDLDLAIISSSPISFSILGKAKEAFSDSDLPFSVDVVDWSSIPETFQCKIKEQYFVLR